MHALTLAFCRICRLHRKAQRSLRPAEFIDNILGSIHNLLVVLRRGKDHDPAVGFSGTHALGKVVLTSLAASSSAPSKVWEAQVSTR
jgi:hypothetical protein